MKAKFQAGWKQAKFRYLLGRVCNFDFLSYIVNCTMHDRESIASRGLMCIEVALCLSSVSDLCSASAKNWFL